MKRQLHLWHRWLGIVLGLLVLLWFGSGVVMMYVPYPALTEAERQAWLAPIDASAVRVSALQAWQATGVPRLPSAVRLNTVAGRPAFHFQPAAGKTPQISVWADTGSVLQASADLAAAAAPSPAAVRSIERIELDQWTFGRVSAHRPLHRVTLDDDAGSVLYVSGRTGELVRDTTRSERAWNWAGSVIHWLYFTPLRDKTEPWRLAVMWSSAITFVLALTGMVLGIQRLRLRRRYKGGRSSPYKGWQAWHHWLGLGAGTLTLTWLFSGWLSVTPFGWLDSPGITAQDRLAFSGGPLTQADLAQPVAAALQSSAGALELEWRRIAGASYFTALTRTGRSLLDAGSGMPAFLTSATLLPAAQAMRPGMPVQSAVMMASEDSYYYSHHGERAFPVLRVRFDTPDEATFYIDPQRGQLASYVDSNRRWNRWLFNGLHQLDFIRPRPAWDILVIALCVLGAMLSGTGIYLGWRRIFH
ncbi:PepSY domain-containing protein [Pseudoduganella sp. DS3]|uniref:PepSY domain-containing protein n=1 Tax=Pseudoduganella guangdongensis TaxID=2692179 RepID=A0A6N9HBR0_9BURK|nr:PepSY domain-containing protein [Pseudoduganella guangdongensis]MYN00657.1 PepSY domain-containing protein [Pseudoduganella guangdongensis]